MKEQTRMLIIRLKTGKKLIREANSYWIDDDTGELFVRSGHFINKINAETVSSVYWAEGEKIELPQVEKLKRKKEGKSDA